MSCEHLVMSYSTFSKAKNDALKEPMFFGQPVNVARYDQQKYEVFENWLKNNCRFFGGRKKSTCRATVSTTPTCPNTKNTFSSAIWNTKPCSTPSKAVVRTLPYCLWCRFPSWKLGLKRGASAKPSTRAAIPTSSAISWMTHRSCLTTSCRTNTSSPAPKTSPVITMIWSNIPSITTC